ncbi:MAG: GC-type dockerin domain-anchored protein [bacterium]
MTRVPRNHRVCPVPALRLAACAGVLCLSGTLWAQAPVWVRTWDGARTGLRAPARDVAHAALADGSGGLYVVGASQSNANTPLPPPLPPIPAKFQSHDDLAVVRLSPSGEVLWSLTYDFPTQGDDNLTPQTQSGNDTPYEAALGADGSLYVLAQVTYRYVAATVDSGNPPQPTETTAPEFGLGIVKVSPSGSVLWSKTYVLEGVTQIDPTSLAIGDSGRVYAAYLARESSGQRNGVLVVNPADGATVTDLMVNASGASAFTLPRVVRRGTGGRVYVASTPPTSSGSSALLTVIDDATTAIIAETFAPGPGSKGVTGLFVGPTSGEVVVSGGVIDLDVHSAMAAKFDASGTHLWTATWNDAANRPWFSAGVVMDASGNVYTAGIQSASSSSPSDLFIVKFPSAGGPAAWATVWNGLANGSEFATGRSSGILLRPTGELVVSGWTQGTAPGDFNMLALPVASATGVVGTPMIYNAALSSGSDDRVSAGMVLMPDGGLVLAGRSSTTSQNMDFIVAKFGGTTACGLSDVAGSGQSIGANGDLTADDIIVYLNWFFAGDTRADVAGAGQSSTPDSQFTADDIIVFLNRFFAGC